MATMLQDMYGATGKVGNKTYYQSDGKTIARVVVTPKNPKTSAQTVQRVLVKAVGLTYAKMKEICNHSFEGYESGARCANRFRSVNLKDLRERASTLQNSGQSMNTFYQFMPLQSNRWQPFAAIISEGHLPKVSVGIDAAGGHKAYVSSPGRTYADFVNEWGLQRGDQVTFVTVQKRDNQYEVNLARIILNPRNADGSGAPMSTEIVNSQGEFPCSHWKNTLNFSVFDYDSNRFNFVLGRGGDVVAAGIIVSRKDKSGGWFRSDCQLVLNEAGLGSDLCSLTAAAENSYAAAPLDFESEYYLNNASSGSYNGTPTDNTSSQGGNTGTGGNTSTGSGTGTGGTTTGGGSTDPDSGDGGE